MTHSHIYLFFIGHRILRLIELRFNVPLDTKEFKLRHGICRFPRNVYVSTEFCGISKKNSPVTIITAIWYVYLVTGTHTG